jgi:ribosomal protein S18 acetylase RimI-like enzyme
VDQRADLRQRHDDRVLGELSVRPAAPADAPDVARLHVTVWRATYRDLAPQAMLDTLDEAHRLRRWQDVLADASGTTATFVAEARSIVGFGHCGPPSDPAFGARGEVKWLYVDQGHARRGIGRRLLAETTQWLKARGYPGVALGVVVGNDPAIAFYAALGGKRIGRYTDPGPNWRSDNLVFAWDF